MPSNQSLNALQALIFNKLRVEYLETHDDVPDHVELDNLATKEAQRVIEEAKKKNNNNLD